MSAQFEAEPQSYSSLLATIRKLMSNLSHIFTDMNEPSEWNTGESKAQYWNNPIDTFIQLLFRRKSTVQWAGTAEMDHVINEALNASVPYPQLIQFIQTSPVFNHLVLMFTEIIVEDLTKLQSRKNRMTKVYEIVHEHLYVTTMALINANLVIVQDTDDVLYSCIDAWINYISMARNVSPHGRMDLSEMFQNLIRLMCESKEDTDNFVRAEKVLGILANVFSNDPTLMDYELREQLEAIFVGISRSGVTNTSRHQWMLQYMNHLVTHEMINELKELAVCIVDFLQVNTLHLCNKLFSNVPTSDISQESSQQYVKVLLQMANFPLTPILEEFFSVRMVDFWLDLADAYSNLPSGTLSPNGSELAVGIFQQVLSIYLPKISLQNKQKVLEHDQDQASAHEFDDFRAAVSDLMESMWSILGNDKLTNVLISNIGNSSDNVDIFGLEAMSLVLNTLLADMTLSESPWICDVLESCQFFIQNTVVLFKAGYERENNSAVEQLIRLDFVRTSSTLMGLLAGYLKQSPSRLNLCIDELFKGLEYCTVNRQGSDSEFKDKVETLIIKAISLLCDTCRSELSSYLPQLFNILSTLLAAEANISNFARENLVRSLGFVLESQVEGGPEQQGQYILQIIDLLQHFIQRSFGISTIAPREQKNYFLCLLTCISELGSALLPTEDAESPALLQRLAEFRDFWKRDPLQIRSKILGLLMQFTNDPAFCEDSGFVEVSCLILGKGLKLCEDEPFFLTFSMSEILSFILNQLPKANISSSLPYYSYLLESLIKRYRDQISPQEFDYVFENIFLKYYHSAIVDDPDLLQTTVSFVNSVLDCKPSLAIQSSHWQSFILPEFINLLSAREKFTIVAITKFWTKVLNNKKYSEADVAATQALINDIGQQVISQTMLGLYNTQRSDLSSYTDLLRAFAAKFPMQTKVWLGNALPQICANNAAHERFTNKLLVTRGNRAAANVVLEWWLECNQLPSL
ncbi:hypothetical protein HG536_0D04490 [Torulaspora globosa]|uniref:Exportin-1/Importin-beta-like domain-containing protein n=1 Tax=Torulaspora globosa TaxID=48254 RepID=A0A7G3ZHE1_9SACH|nr:uncharacterized protein HG536_0D04490 [Torulaspora globosa]QLL32927.1 hypothetical protein HG536_0D04490 [Torulaspora globosa]